jgi:toxin ParE1/3/4
MGAPARTAKWSPEAIADLDAIWSYYERATGRSTAEKIVREIDQLVVTVEAHPFAGRARDELRPGVRSLAAKPHVLFYRALPVPLPRVALRAGRKNLVDVLPPIKYAHDLGNSIRHATRLWDVSRADRGGLWRECSRGM